MISTKIENIIVKYLTGEASAPDLDFLSQWIRKPENQQIFDDYVRIYFETNALMGKPDVGEIKEILLKKIKKDKNPFLRQEVLKVFKYAAAVLLLIGLGYFFREVNFNSVNDTLPSKTLMTKDEAVTIELFDGTFQELDIKGSTEIKDANGNLIAKQEGAKLLHNDQTNSDRILFNVLNVPDGKRFDIELSDGSHVYMNSGSKLRYPIKFLDESPREVYLEGEAFFEVAHNETNPFTVHADEMEIRVLGTKFNVNDYPEKTSIQTVLVEGSVALNNRIDAKNDGLVLRPGQMGEWTKNSGELSSQTVDLSVHTAWMQGKLIFRNTTFRNIRFALTRHYNVSIKNENTALEDQRFDATFDIETIEEVLESFSSSYEIQYEIINNEILIK